MNEDFKAIADRMRELGLRRDLPFSEPIAPTWEQELNEKMMPKTPAVVVEDDIYPDMWGY